jgi:hypothetical protein
MPFLQNFFTPDTYIALQRCLPQRYFPYAPARLKRRFGWAPGTANPPSSQQQEKDKPSACEELGLLLNLN